VGGVGKVLEKILFAFGLKTMGDVREQLAVMMYAFPPATAEFLLFATLGISQGEGKCENENSKNENSKNENSGECSEDIGRKSLGAERTFSLCCESPDEQKNKLKELCYKVGEKLKEKNLWGKTVTLKVKTVKFELFTRSVTNKSYFQNGEIIEKLSFKLLETLFPLKIRLIGVTISKFKNEQNTTSSTSSPLRSSLSNFFKSSKSPKNILIDGNNCDGNNDENDNSNNYYDDIDKGSNSNSKIDYDKGTYNNYSNNNNNRKEDITSVRAHSPYGHVDLFDPNDRGHGDEELEENGEIEIGGTDLTDVLPVDDGDDIETDINGSKSNCNIYDNGDDDDGDGDDYEDHCLENNNNNDNNSNIDNCSKSKKNNNHLNDNCINNDSDNAYKGYNNSNYDNGNHTESSIDMSSECEILMFLPTDGDHNTSNKTSIQHRKINNTTTAQSSSFSSFLSSCPALTQKHHHPCPVCGKIIPGTLFALNMHIDKCLLVGSEISRCSQNHRNSFFSVDDNSPENVQCTTNRGGREDDDNCSSFSTSFNDGQCAVRRNSNRMKNPAAGGTDSKKNKLLTNSTQFTKTKKIKNSFDSRECNNGQENGNKITNFLFHLGRK
jgi:hypothetical protein